MTYSLQASVALVNPIKREALSRIVTRRESSLFAESMNALKEDLRSQYRDKCVLVVGAGGFIARQTIDVVRDFQPRQLILIDQSENGLSETVRSIRATEKSNPAIKINSILGDIGSKFIEKVIRSVNSIDITLNFAAAKHVRSESNQYSVMRMIQTNILGCEYLLNALEEHHSLSRFFSVSTDKAADPVSFMGASKRVMEQIIARSNIPSTSARFANVAFSTGSLLENWLVRLASVQPVAVPKDTYRYFVSPREAGELCALATVARANSVVVPKMNQQDLQLLQEVLEQVLHAFEIVPQWLEVDKNIELPIYNQEFIDQKYPAFLTTRDTPGEKKEEKFKASNETITSWTKNLETIDMTCENNDLSHFLEVVEDIVANPKIETSLRDLERLFNSLDINFKHLKSEQKLDDRL